MTYEYPCCTYWDHSNITEKCFLHNFHIMTSLNNKFNKLKDDLIRLTTDNAEYTNYMYEFLDNIQTNFPVNNNRFLYLLDYSLNYTSTFYNHVYNIAAYVEIENIIEYLTESNQKIEEELDYLIAENFNNISI